MDEQQAKAVAEALGGEAWQSGGGIWLILLHRDDGKLTVLSDEAVCEYQDAAAFAESDAMTSILLH